MGGADPPWARFVLAWEAVLAPVGGKAADGAAAAELGRALTDNTPAVRQVAIQSLGGIGTVGLPGLLQALADPSSLLGEMAGDAIVALGPEAIPALESMQKGPDPAMQKKAAALIRRIERKTHKKKKTL